MSATSMPKHSCFLILEPGKQNVQLLKSKLRQPTLQKFLFLNQAADIAKVPRYFGIDGDSDDSSHWILKPCEKTKNRVFIHPETKSLWQNNDLVTALKSEKRDRLFICGFWLDVNLGPVAMDAYVEGFDVHVLTDLVFSRTAGDHSDALSRLTQIGIVPITTAQLVHEWMSWTPDLEGASELKTIRDNIVS